jgi:hypothetical protein
MDSFISELPALIVTLAVLTVATVLIVLNHIGVSDALAILGVLVSPAVAFWFLGKAYSWQPPATIQPTVPQAPTSPSTNASQPPT